MDVRRLVSFGNSSFVISLPKAWVIKNGLKKGDMLRIEERPYELVVSAREEGKKKLSETVINCEGRNLNELKTEIIAAYANNSNIIKISGSNIKNISPSIKQIVHGLFGMEVIEETSSNITVKDLLDVSEVSIDSIVKRMDILVKSMMEDSLFSDKLESVLERDNEVNRLALLAVRIFRAATYNPGMLKIFNTNYWDMFISRQVTVQLEHIGDYTKRIAKLMRENKPNDDLKKLYLQLTARYREAMKTYYNKDKPSSYKLETDSKKFMQMCDKLLERKRDVAMTRTIELLKQMTKSIMYILRGTMEHD